MKITYNWLKDFVEIKIAPKMLANKLTMAGLEVTSLEEKNKDFVFELEITSNRPDCLSVIGIAREVAAITNKKLRVTSYELRVTKRATIPLKINIEDKKDCPLYTAKIIQDVKVKPSPDWLKERLELIGCRSVNNIVDITNYVLFTWGEPLHAFDLDKLNSDKIIVRRAKKDEKITTIDGQERMLGSDILVIADNKRPVAIAGVMGGRDTEVTQNTKNILLEAAIFNPIITRRVRQKLGLQTDSSYRFERGIDYETVETASLAAMQLIQELGQGKFILAKSSRALKPKRKKISLNVAFVAKILGVEIAPSEIKKILTNLGFKVKTKSKNNFLVEIPTFRQDINLEIELIEEIARIFSYEKIPLTLPRILPQIIPEESQDLVSLIKDILVGLGLNEVITYSLTDKDLLASLELSYQNQIEIANPLSQEQAVLRPTLISGLSQCIATNLNQKQDCVNIFEVARVFQESMGEPKEELRLGIGLCGTKSLLLSCGLIKDETGFLHLKGILEILFNRLGISNYKFIPTDLVSQILLEIGQEKIGFMKHLSETTLEKFEIKNRDVFVLELSLDKLMPYINLKRRFTPLPKYPGITRDISLILKEEIKAKEVLEAIKEKGRPLLQEVKIIDYYKGRHIPLGFKGLTISCLYRSDARTLTEAEVNPLADSVLALLKERFSAQIR